MSFNLAVMLSETAHSRAGPARWRCSPKAGSPTGSWTMASDRLAASLAASGIEPGDPVALQLPNIPEVRGRLLRHPQGRRCRRARQCPAQGARGALPPRRRSGEAQVLITWGGVLDQAAEGRGGGRGEANLRRRRQRRRRTRLPPVQTACWRYPPGPRSTRSPRANRATRRSSPASPGRPRSPKGADAHPPAAWT